MRSYKLILAVLTALLWSGGVFGQGFVERFVKGTENVETNLHFIYQGTHIPVLDISYHEFSADSITWRKNYVDGDCYIRFNNYTDNSINPYNGLEGYHPDSTWWAFNFCTCNGAIPEAINTVDTLFIYYYQTDTTYIIDTVVVTDGTLNVNIPFPDTVSGSSTNFQDTLSHTHDLYVFIGDNEDVDTTGRFDGAVLKWNATSEMWEVAADLIGGGGGTFLTVTEEDNSPSVPNVNEIRVTNGHLTNNGLGSVSLDLSIDATDAENDFYRTGKVRVPAGDNFITFSSALPDTDYVVASVYAQLDWQQARQSLWYDSLATDGFRVLDVIDSAWVHYIAIRDLDSLLLALNGTGLVYASGTDTTLGYLSTSVDDSTITVINNELHVLDTALYHSNLRDLNWSGAGHVMDTTLDMKGFMIDSVGIVSMDTSYTVTGSEDVGQFYWDDGTYNFVLDTMTIGLDTLKIIDAWYGEMYQYENAVLTTIGTQNTYHAVCNFTGGSVNGFTFVSGSEGSFTAVANYGGTVPGTVLITDVAHGLTTGDIVTIHGSTNYNGVFSVTVVNNDSFYITAAFVATNTGDWAEGCYLLCNIPGVYMATATLTAFAASTNTLFKFELFKNATGLNNMAVSRVFSTTDFGSLATHGIVSLSVGDRIWLATMNQTSSTDITVRHSNVTLNRL